MGLGKSSHLTRCVHISLTLPHVHYFNVTPKACSVAACLFQQRGHGLAIHRVCFILVVAFRATVKETALKLVCSTRLCAPPIDRRFSYQFLAAVNLMTDCESVISRFPSEPFDRHLPNACGCCVRNCFSSRRRVYHPVGMSCISAHRYRALASYPTIDLHVSLPRIVVTSFSW